MVFYPLNSPIAKKLVWWFIAISTLVAVFSTLVQLYLDYRHQVGNIKSYLERLEETYLPSIAQNTWLMDDNQISTLLEGITNRDDISYAAVSIDGKERWTSGRKTDLDQYKAQLPIFYSHKEKEELIGTLMVIANLEGVYFLIARRAVIVLLANSIKTFIVAGLALAIVQYFVTRHLQSMAAHASKINFQDSHPPLVLSRKKSSVKDELDALSTAISSMQKRGYISYQAVHKTEQQLRLFLNSTEEGIIGVDHKGMVLFANNVCLGLLRETSEQAIAGQVISEVLKSSCLDGYHGRDRDTTLLDFVRDGKIFRCDDSFITRHDQSGFYASLRAYPTFSNGDNSGSVIFFSDTTSQRESIHQRRLLEEALNHAPIAVIITDRFLNIVYVNPEFQRSTGLSSDQVVGRKVDSISSSSAFLQVCEDAKEQIFKGSPWQSRFNYELTPGKSSVIDVITSPIYNDSGEITNFVAISHDVSFEVELQRQLTNAHKHKALGRLSSSIAHEFGNPLLGIKSLIKDIYDKNRLDPDDPPLLKIALDECSRMQELINDIYNFYGVEESVPMPCDLKVLIEKILHFHQKTFIDHNISAVFNHSATLPPVRGKESQLAQVVFNLIINAVEAMSEFGGTLTLELTPLHNEIILTVRDTGPGMDETTLERVFEPFFSTKPEVEGIGLGLPVSYGIITAHGGNITCSSIPEEGSTFKITLPIWEGNA